jgi:hypothetical protein
VPCQKNLVLSGHILRKPASHLKLSFIVCLFNSKYDSSVVMQKFLFTLALTNLKSFVQIKFEDEAIQLQQILLFPKTVPLLK